MQQPAKSIAARALFLRLSLLGLSSTTATLSVSTVHADESVVEIAYSAPAGCPTKQQFEQRLRARLGAETRALRGTLSLRLTQHPTHTRGELAITSGPRSGARREVEAASCDEAVDALTLVTALLIEPERAQAERPVGSRRAGAARHARASVDDKEGAALATRGARAPATADAAPAAGASTPEPATAQAAQPTSADGSKGPSPSEIAATPTARATKPATPSAPPKRAPEPPPAARTAQVEPEESPASADRSTRSFSVELVAAALLATGAMPALRPGAELRGSLARSLSKGFAAGLELGARGLAPQLAKNTQGHAQFAFYGGTAALCLAHLSTRLSGAICALSELARLSAQGRNTDAPKRAELFFRALGPALRASLRLTQRWSLALGAELLFPLTRDSFELGGSELWSVPSLTFRGSLGVALRFE